MALSHKTKWRESLIKQDAVNTARAAGYAEGYVKALDDAIWKFAGYKPNMVMDILTIHEIINQLKSAYAGGEK